MHYRTLEIKVAANFLKRVLKNIRNLSQFVKYVCVSHCVADGYFSNIAFERISKNFVTMAKLLHVSK